MGEKLTLRMDRALIERAKNYARSRGKSVSGLVSDYFALLETPGGSRQPQEEGPEDEALPPITRSLRGVLRGARVDEADYRSHLERKHG